MSIRLITWVDLQGRYRSTVPAYKDATRPEGESDDECLERVWKGLVEKGGYGIAIDHPHHYVDDNHQRQKIKECCGNEFRYAGKPDANGDRSGVGGAWEMEPDGTPKVNMAKARIVHMDKIRAVRDRELMKRDISLARAVDSGDTSAQKKIAAEKKMLKDIPQTFDLNIAREAHQLQELWPKELLTKNN